MRSLYRERQSALIQSARRRLDGLLEVRPTATGMHLVAWLPRGGDDRVAARAAAEAGIEAAVDRLASVLAECSRRAGAPGRPTAVPCLI